jgi:hypothetical protein
MFFVLVQADSDRVNAVADERMARDLIETLEGRMAEVDVDGTDELL